MKEIRLHGRGGQGVVKASHIVVKAAVGSGTHGQFIPFFGVERKGSPVFGFLRLSNEPIRRKTQVYEPDILIIFDDTLVKLPATYAGLKTGDLIRGAGGRSVSDAASLIAALEEGGEEISLQIRRGAQELELPVSPAVGEEGRPMLGILLRDGLSGIGTLTFCDPDSGVFGALGHSISDSETGLTVPLRDGSITEAQIVAVQPGSAGTPGELNGVSDLSRALGTVERNTEVGIFGHMSAALGDRPAEIGLITAGPASILATVEGRAPREFAVEINRVCRDSEGTHAMFTVTDPALLGRTGGIVQGMSGSPILQDGKLVGAVTHVFVNDPTRGYGISIQDMLKASGLAMDQAA